MKLTRLLSAILFASLSLFAFAADAPSVAKRYGTWGVDLEGMDKTVKPGDDFFRYVNGKWAATTQIPPDKTSFGAFTGLRDISEERVRVILDRWAADKNLKAGSDEAKVAAIYRTFLDEAAVEKLDAKPIEPQLEALKKAETRDDIAKLMARTTSSFGRALFNAGVSDDSKNPEKYALYLSQSGIGLADREFYLRENFKPQKERYQKYVADMLRLAGWEEPDKNAADIVAMETAIAEGMWTRAEGRNRDKTYNPMTVADLEKNAPGFPWTVFFKEAGIDKADRAVVRQNTAFPKLAKIYADTPVATLRAWQAFHVIDDAAPLLSKRFAEANWEFRSKFLRGQQEERPRWKRAVEAAEGTMGEAIGRTYVAEHFPPDSKMKMEKLVADLRAAMKGRIEKLEWMGPETKARALDKLAKFGVKIGYPTKWRDYSKLEVREGDLVGNAQRAAKFEWDYDVARIGKSVDEAEWGMTPQTVNAYYSSAKNEIVFPAAILQPPFFDPKADPAVNYGAHRRGDRPRDHARLRRPGPQVRRHGHAARLVGGDGRGEVRSAGGEARRAVRSPRAAAGEGPQDHRQADHGREHRRPRRHPDGPRCLPDLAEWQTRAGPRRIHRRPARLPRLGPGLADDDARRRAPPVRHDRLPLPRHGPRLRPAPKRRRLVRGLRGEGRGRELREAGGAGEDLVVRQRQTPGEGRSRPRPGVCRPSREGRCRSASPQRADERRCSRSLFPSAVSLR